LYSETQERLFFEQFITESQKLRKIFEERVTELDSIDANAFSNIFD